MPSFSPTDAAFEGFRFTKERPGAVAAWAGVTLLFSLASSLLAALIGGSAMAQFEALTDQYSWSDLVTVLPRLLPAVFVAVVINLAGSAVVYASAVRSFIGIDRKVSFHAGEDERRIILILLVYGLVYLVVSAVWGVCFGFLVNILNALFPQLHDAIVSAIPWVSIRAFLSALFLAFPPIAAIVRLSLAPVIAVDRKRINFRESWVSTHGHFWPLAGSLALSVFLYLVVVFVALMLVMALAQVLSISTQGAIGPQTLTGGADRTTLADLLKPAAIFAELLTAAMVAAALPVIFGPLVRAYQAYDAPDAPPQPAPPIHA
jgi:hypothetical protein